MMTFNGIQSLHVSSAAEQGQVGADQEVGVEGAPVEKKAKAPRKASGKKVVKSTGPKSTKKLRQSAPKTPVKKPSQVATPTQESLKKADSAKSDKQSGKKRKSQSSAARPRSLTREKSKRLKRGRPKAGTYVGLIWFTKV